MRGERGCREHAQSSARLAREDSRRGRRMMAALMMIDLSGIAVRSELIVALGAPINGSHTLRLGLEEQEVETRQRASSVEAPLAGCDADPSGRTDDLRTAIAWHSRTEAPVGQKVGDATNITKKESGSVAGVNEQPLQISLRGLSSGRR